MNNLGALHNRLGNHEQALAVLDEALDGRRQVLGKEHLEVAVTTYHLANALHGLERDSEAGQAYADAVRIMKQAAGPDDRRVGVLLNGLAEFQLENGDLDAAYTSITEALEINIDAWPEGHRTTAQSRLTAARIELARGQTEAAVAHVDTALQVFDTTPGAQDQAALAAAVLAIALHELGRSDRIETLRARALAILKDDVRHAALVRQLSKLTSNR